jgi:DNA replication protein DnaC
LCRRLLDYNDRRVRGELEAEFVVLDDFGGEYVNPGGAAESHIDELLWTRHGERRATIITTNLTPDQLRGRLSDRILDRLLEWGHTVTLTAPSMRTRDGDDKLDPQGITQSIV